jgi:hypothetical protein
VFSAEGEGAAFDKPLDRAAEGVGLFGVEAEFFGDDAGFDGLIAGALHVVQHAAGEVIERHGRALAKKKRYGAANHDTDQLADYKLPL